MNQTDWSKYYDENEPDSEVQETNIEQENQNTDTTINWNDYYDREDKWKTPEPVRHTSRGLARFGETIAGLPGDTVQFAKSLLSYLPKTPKFLNREQNFIQKMGKEALESFPTSQELKEVSSYLTSGFTDPQSAEEEFGDDIISLGTAILTGLKDPTKLKTLGKAFGVASGAKVGGKVSELYGVEEKGQSATEIGIIGLYSLLTRRFADAFVRNKYQKAHSLVPQGTMQNTGSFINDLNQVETQLKKGLSKTSPTKQKTLSVLDEIKGKASGGAMPVEDLVESYVDINEFLNSKQLFDELGTSGKKLLKKRIDKVKNAVSNSIEDYGKSNSEFYKEWTEANRAHAILQRNKSAKDFLTKNIKTIPGHLAMSMAFKTFLGIPALSSLGAGFAAFQAGKIMSRIANNKTLREYYFQVLDSAAKENLPQTINRISKFKKQLEKEED